MSTIVIFLAALLACSLLAGWLIKVRSRRRQLPWTNAFADAQTRKLTPEERSAVENYLESLTQVLQVPGPTGASAAPISLTHYMAVEIDIDIGLLTEILSNVWLPVCGIDQVDNTE